MKIYILLGHPDSESFNGKLNCIERATLEFCGFKPAKATRISSLNRKDELQRAKILKSIEKIFHPKILDQPKTPIWLPEKVLLRKIYAHNTHPKQFAESIKSVNDVTFSNNYIIFS